jgi:hypothetical protein
MSFDILTLLYEPEVRFVEIGDDVSEAEPWWGGIINRC